MGCGLIAGALVAGRAAPHNTLEVDADGCSITTHYNRRDADSEAGRSAKGHIG